MREFRDAGFTKMKKKKVLYNKCISVEVLSTRGDMDDLWLLFFLLAFWSTPRWLSLSRSLLRKRAQESSHRKIEKLTRKKKKIFHYSRLLGKEVRIFYTFLGSFLRIKILSSNPQSISIHSFFYHFSLRIFKSFYFSLMSSGCKIAPCDLR